MKTRRTIRRLLAALAALVAFVGGWATASAADPASFAFHLDYSNSNNNVVPGQQWVVPIITMDSYQKVSVMRCVKVQLSAGAYGTGGMPAGTLFDASSDLLGGYLNGPNWTNPDLSSWPSGVVTWSNSTGSTPSYSNWFGFLIHQMPSAPAGSTLWVTISSYSGVGDGSGNCTGAVLDGPSTSPLIIIPNTSVATVVPPTLSLSITGRSSICNGQAAANFQSSSTSTAVGLGHLNASNVGGGAQDLTLTSNAGNGANVYIRTSGATPNALRDGAGHNIADISGTNSAPGSAPTAGTEGFGYTSNDTSTAFTTNTWAKLTSANSAVLVSGSATKSACVGFAATVAPSTAAGSYSTNVVYTALANF